MIALLQRVSAARVEAGGRLVGEIGRGIAVLVGVTRDDEKAQAARLAERLCAYRVFPDDSDRMNLSVTDIGGGVLLVPQFTLAANTKKGTRASFTRAAEPGRGRELFEALVDETRRRVADVATGEFGAHMSLTLTNDGPVTFWLEARPD